MNIEQKRRESNGGGFKRGYHTLADDLKVVKRLSKIKEIE
jgi:hypothetical protein